MDVKQIDANTIEVTVTAQPVTTTVQYDYGFLKQQRVDIQAQKDRDNAARDAELAEVDALIAQADKLGVIARPVAVEVPIAAPAETIQ